MNNEPKISVIVPVYKAEAYLERCVNSLLAQTFSEFEILLIDDGSPDNSGKICDEYAAKDNRVKVFHKENGGVSSARQCGINNARGEYTIHVDPDDWVDNVMLNELYKKAKEDYVDMVFCDYYENYDRDNIQVYVNQKPSSLDCDTIIRELFQHLHGSCCNKLIRRVCYNKYNVSFPLQFNYSEDLYVILSLLKNNLTVSYLPKAFYHYVKDVNENSLCKSYTDKTVYNDLQMKSMFVGLLSDTIHKNDCNNRLSFFIVNRAFRSEILSSKDFKRHFYDCRKAVLNYKLTDNRTRFYLYLSCIGFYDACLSLIRLLKRVKKFIKYVKYENRNSNNMV